MIKFDRKSFFPKKKDIFIVDLIDLLGDQVKKYNINNNFQINDISSLDYLRENSAIFLDRELDNSNLLSNYFCIITNNENNLNYNYQNIFLVSNLSSSYNNLINNMYYHEDIPSFPDDFQYVNGSYLSKFSKIDKTVKIGKNCVIGRGVQIDSNVIIKNNVVIKNAIIKSNTIICDNTSIGTTGFGFDFKNRGARFLNPQIGVVIIEDNCHIGASCTIDRGKIDATIIGKNSMLDNLVHIAHNVHLGDNACIAAQTGISGSVKIGSNSTIGGQVGFAGHINIGNNVIIAAKSGVTKNIKDNSVVAGFPAVDIKLWKRKIIKERKNGYK